MAGKTSAETKDVDVAPAVLVKTRQDLLASIGTVKPFVSCIHIDVMDDKFVPNKTVGAADFQNLPNGVSYEFHWMVESPEKQISRLRGNHLHIVHVETIKGNWDAVKRAVKSSGGRLGIAINPETPLEAALPFVKDVELVLVMSVHPGFSGQSYIKEVEEKIHFLRKKFPKLEIEVDGGIDFSTGASAVKAGASKLASASAIFKAPDVGGAVSRLRKGGRL